MANINENEVSSTSQTKQIAQWLQQGNTITQMEALEMYGCFRLSSRINDIKKNYGWEIVSDRITTTTGKRVACYRLVSEGGEQ